MAIKLPHDREAPEHTTVAGYFVSRLGEAPSVVYHYAETVTMREVFGIAPTDSRNLDELNVPSLRGRNDLLNREFFDSGNTSVGTLISLTEVDETTVTAKFSIETETAPMQISTVLMNTAGVEGHRQAETGRYWTVTLPLSGAALTRGQQVMLGVYVEAVMTYLQAVGDSTPLETVQYAIIALAQQGVSIDSFIADQGEALEQDRRAGKAPFVFSTGNAPTA